MLCMHRYSFEQKGGICKRKTDGNTYVERLPQHNPAGLRLNLKIVQILCVVRRREAVNDGTVVVRVLIGSGNTQNIRANAGVLLHVLDVFLCNIS